jgi:hypothetical protein
MAVPHVPTAPQSAVSPATLPAEPGRARPGRPPKRPEIKLSAAREESRWIGPVPLAIGLFALAMILGFAHRYAAKTEDENYAKAKASLDQYELSRTEAERNYDSSLYQDALAALAKVDPGSVSASAAAALAADIQQRTDLFHRRIRAREAAQATAQQVFTDRDKEFLAAHQRDLLTPKKVYPECKEGGQPRAH